VEESIRFSTAASGTSLTRTQIFKDSPSGCCKRASVREIRTAAAIVPLSLTDGSIALLRAACRG